MIIGKQDGTFSFYRNSGTLSSPNFALATDSLGKVHTKALFSNKGNSTPFLVDSMGTTFMYSGSLNGNIYKFGNIDGNLNGTFTVIDSSLANIWEGVNSYISIADITSDGNLDMIVGNKSGGISYYTRDLITSISKNESLSNLNIYPNPTNGLIHIDTEKNNLKNANIQIIDLLGKILYNQQISSRRTIINLNNYSTGVYLIKFSNDLGNKVYKVIKK